MKSRLHASFGLFGPASGLAMNNHLAPTRPFGPQRQAFLPVKPIDEVAANRPPFPPKQDVDASISITNSNRDNLVHPLSNFPSGDPGRSACAGWNDAGGQGAGPPLAVAVTRRHVVHNVLHERWPGNFFDSTSCKMALSRLSSATSLRRPILIRQAASAREPGSD